MKGKARKAAIAVSAKSPLAVKVESRMLKRLDARQTRLLKWKYTLQRENRHWCDELKKAVAALRANTALVVNTTCEKEQAARSREEIEDQLQKGIQLLAVSAKALLEADTLLTELAQAWEREAKRLHARGRYWRKRGVGMIVLLEGDRGPLLQLPKRLRLRRTPWFLRAE